MRIIGGAARGRKLQPPGKRFGRKLRPTSDRAREALFNIIGPRVCGSTVLDLFAGTGAVGLEALSRGARSALFVDISRGALELVRENIALCGFEDGSAVLKRDLGKGLGFLPAITPAGGFDLVFLDPPYGLGLPAGLLAELAAMEVLQSNGLVIAEAGRDEEMPLQTGSLYRIDRRRYGAACFWIYRFNKEGDNDQL